MGSQAQQLPVVSFDESGNSGENLLDPLQPFFCLASVHLAEDVAEAAEVLIRQPNPTGAPELRFTRLRRSARGRDTVLRLLQSDLLTPESARVTPIHKPFMAVTKLFDLLMEPTFHESGVNVYAEGLHVAFSEVLYEQGATACGDAQWRDLLDAFILMFRTRSDLSIERFVLALEVARLSTNDATVRRLLDLVPKDKTQLKEIATAGDQDGVGGLHLDPAPTSVFEHCLAWQERLGRHVVVHDHSRAVNRFLPFLERLADPGLPQVVGPAWAPGYRLPLDVASFKLARSHEVLAIQLADVVAGACIAWITESLVPAALSDFANDLGQTVLPQLVQNRIWPTSMHAHQALSSGPSPQLPQPTP